MTEIDLSQLDWIVFDIDGTLWDHDAACRIGLEAIALEHQIDFDPFHDAFHRANLEMWRQLESGTGDHLKLRVDRFEISFREIGFDHDRDLCESISTSYLAKYLEARTVLPNARELVRQCHPHVRMGVATNGGRDTQMIKLSHLEEEADLFRFVLCSGDTPYLKPNPEFFTEARKLAENADPTRILMIGDSWSGDILPPRAQNWKTLWLSHGRPLPEAHPDVWIAETLAHVAIR